MELASARRAGNGNRHGGTLLDNGMGGFAPMAFIVFIGNALCKGKDQIVPG
jgi:hypothetical protein